MTKRRQHYANIIRNFANCPEAGAVNMEAYVDTEIDMAIERYRIEKQHIGGEPILSIKKDND